MISLDNSYVELSDWSALLATGADAIKFINGFCTNDLKKLVDGQSCEAFFTNVKAKVLAYATVGRISETELLIVLSSPNVQALADHLDKYLICEKVELTRLADYEFLLTGAEAQASDCRFAVPAVVYGSGVNIYGGVKDEITALKSSLSDAGCSLMPTEAFEQHRIQQGIPADGRDVDDRNLPQEVDRQETTISFTKGCYLGQEPIARIDALGQVNWLLRGLKFSGSEVPEAGAELKSDDKIVGRVTSAAKNNDGQLIGLGYVRRQLVAASGDNQKTLFVNDDTPVEIVTLPFEG